MIVSSKFNWFSSIVAITSDSFVEFLLHGSVVVGATVVVVVEDKVDVPSVLAVGLDVGLDVVVSTVGTSVVRLDVVAGALVVVVFKFGWLQKISQLWVLRLKNVPWSHVCK